tara:strand:+ start:660 stop:860 length:201 start_codon:yes stop_codon:yes gene_type:complete
MTIPIQLKFIDNVFNNTQKNIIESNIEIEYPFKTSFIIHDEDTTVDIEENYTLSIGDGCILIIEEN